VRCFFARLIPAQSPFAERCCVNLPEVVRSSHFAFPSHLSTLSSPFSSPIRAGTTKAVSPPFISGTPTTVDLLESC
jgi:hypothetical protein